MQLTLHLAILAILVDSQRIGSEVSVMVAREVRRVSKMEAVNILDVSLSTVERMIKRGQLQVEKEDLGGQHRIWIVLDEDSGDLSEDKSPESSPEVPKAQFDRSERDELLTLRVQVKGLEELSAFRAEQLRESEMRFQQILHQMELLTRALPPPGPIEKPLRRWWPWRRRA